jgi:hypothetical protein
MKLSLYIWYNMSNAIGSIKLDPPEKETVYYFPRNEKVELKEVTELIVSDSGTHYLKTKDGKSHTIPIGWIHIELDIEEWV